ncbi:alpha-galactosidase [Planctomycetota bacterium]|nr:alpha-galactosidase [Planctomycetota bacterium]
MDTSDMECTFLDQCDLSHVLQGWETPKANCAVTGGPLSIAGHTFERGVGTHTVGWLGLALHRSAHRFSASVGVDDAVGRHGHGRVRFLVRGDGRTLYDSGVVRGGEAARRVDLDVAGVALLELICDAPDDNTHHGHADWCEALVLFSGQRPLAVARPRGEPEILTPVPSPAPRFVGGWLLAANPGSPLLYTLPCQGEEALRFSAEGLPAGLHLDRTTGILSGVAPPCGRYPVLLTATNTHGQAQRVLTLVTGTGLAATPPMGWSSWNCCHAAVNADRVRANATALVQAGLHRCGYRYVNIDDGWQGGRSQHSAIPMALQGNAGFPDPGGLASDLHRLGLLAGIYHVPNVHSPQGLAGASSDHPDGTTTSVFTHGGSSPRGACDWFRQDIAQFTAWGFDYLKVDNGPTVAEARLIAEAIRAGGRDLVLSLSAGMPRDLIPDYRRHAQLWRTTGDLIDTWFSVRNKLRAQVAWQGLGGPGGWNDPDMLVVGAVGPGWNAPLQPSRLSYSEQYLHIGMWAFLAAPLMIGGDLTRLDDFTRSLLSNPEIIELDQDPLGAPALLIDQAPERGQMRWRRHLSGGDVAVALVNLGEEPSTMGFDLSELGLGGTWIARDPWRCHDLEQISTGTRVEVPAHHHRLLRLRRIGPG